MKNKFSFILLVIAAALFLTGMALKVMVNDLALYVIIPSLFIFAIGITWLWIGAKK
jgi:hypothetical protein